MSEDIRVPDVDTETLASIALTLGYKCCPSHLRRGEITETEYRAALTATIATLGAAHMLKMEDTGRTREINHEVCHSVGVQVGLTDCDNPHHSFIPNDACCGPVWALSRRENRS